MKTELSVLSRGYQEALRNHLAQRNGANSGTARRLGKRAMTLGLETLDLARMHDQAMIALALALPPEDSREALIGRAGSFFAEAIIPIEDTHRTTREATARLRQANEALSRRTADLAASNLELQEEIGQRKTVEAALRKSERHYSQLLEESRLMQAQLRLLSRQLLATQEEERKKISRELHDEIAQTLTGITVRLAALKSEATVNSKGLQKKIASTQRMVEKSVEIVHRFARELRPAVLDDLGLIPALLTYVKGLSKRTGIQMDLKVYAAVEDLPISKRTVLFRVAQEALTNVAKHARATRVEISITKVADTASMSVNDDGKSFDVERVLLPNGTTRLGLLGMRERVEMVGGSFEVESTPGNGTTVWVRIPLADVQPRPRRGRKSPGGIVRAEP